jgi:hypothetical protein
MTLTEKARAYIEANPRPARAMYYLFADELGFQKAPYAKSFERKDLGGLISSARSSVSASAPLRGSCTRNRKWWVTDGRALPAGLCEGRPVRDIPPGLHRRRTAIGLLDISP